MSNKIPTMTRAHFQFLADLLREMELANLKDEFDQGGESAAREWLIREFTSNLAMTNYRFDRERFIAACRSEA
jgi:hypothetical protein